MIEAAAIPTRAASSDRPRRPRSRAMACSAQQLLGGHEPAADEPERPVGGRGGVALVGDQQDGAAAVADRAQRAEDGLGRGCVEVPVGSSARMRKVVARPGDRDALLLAAGERVGKLVGHLGDAEALEQLARVVGGAELGS